MMRRSILRDLLILVGIFGLIWLLATFIHFPEDPQVFPVEKEEKIGETYLDVILLNPIFREYEHPRVDSAVRTIGDRLLEGLGESEYGYRFVVFENEMINAFTIPGGNILISTGLIRFCDHPEELAAVMAHEMGHVEERHVVSRLLKELGIEILTSGDTFVMGEVTGMLTSTGFDRKQEEEADLFSTRLLEHTGIEPRTLATFFRKLEAETNNDLLQHFEIVSTHPNFNSRIREVLSYVPGEDFKAAQIEIDWDSVRSILP